MPDREEVLSGLYGAYRLAWFDVSGMTLFNLTVEGFWRSFFAAVLVVPAYAVLVGLRAPAGRGQHRPRVSDREHRLCPRMVRLSLVALVLTRLLGLDRNYVALIVAHNWSAVLQMAVFVAVVLLGVIVPAALGTLLGDRDHDRDSGLPVVRDPYRAPNLGRDRLDAAAG